MQFLANKANRLFIILGGFLIANALTAELIGGKIFSLETTLGIAPIHWQLLGASGTLDFTAGVVLWPFVFIMTDLINEYFGTRGVRFLSYLAVGLIAYAFLMLYVAIGLEPAAWWLGSQAGAGVPDMQVAFAKILGQGQWIIIASIIAFLVGQLIDVAIFHRIKRLTGERLLWLRATGSTIISQLIDSFVVLYIAFVIGSDWSIQQFLAVGMVNFVYKLLIAIVLTPLLYFVHSAIDAYLGAELSEQMRSEAMKD